jgi:dTDP-4-dehydrorhamnose 3,5-epimerase
MEFRETELAGVMIVEPDVFRDVRGFFFETYHQKKYSEGGIKEEFVQDNHSKSSERTLRGLHAQLKNPQGKLVRVIEGEIWDVAVDIRRGSPSFGRWVGVSLSAANHRQIYVPPGFAHGFCVISPTAQVEYKCTAFYDPADEISILWNDPEIGITWPVREPILSARDQKAGPLSQHLEVLPVFAGES